MASPNMHAAEARTLLLWKRLVHDSQLNPYARRTSLPTLPLRTRLLIAAVGWLLLVSFFWIALSWPLPLWAQAAGWALEIAWLILLSSLYVRFWKKRVGRELN